VPCNSRPNRFNDRKHQIKAAINHEAAFAVFAIFAERFSPIWYRIAALML
jgi:hypothetical protein